MGRSVSASCVAWCAARLPPAPTSPAAAVGRVEQHRETCDDDRRHDRRNRDDDDLVHLVAERRVPSLRERAGTAARQQARSIGSGECPATRDAAEDGRRSPLTDAQPRARSIPNPTTYQGSTHCVVTSRFTRPTEFSARSATSISASDVPRNHSDAERASGHQQEPQQRSDEHDVEQWIRRENRNLKDVTVVGESRVHDEELPDREPGGDRNCRPVDQPVAPSQRRPNDDDPSHPQRDEGVREEIEAIGGRHRRSPLAEDRVDGPDRRADHDHRGGESEQLPWATRLSRRHARSQGQCPCGARARRDCRDRGCLRARNDDDDGRKREGREREPPRPGTRQSYHDTSSASRRARSSAS